MSSLANSILRINGVTELHTRRGCGSGLKQTKSKFAGIIPRLHAPCKLSSRAPKNHLSTVAQSSNDADSKQSVPYILGVASGALLLSAVALNQDVYATPGSSLLTKDEISTVNLFKQNTPSVVYITNLASKQDVFTLNVEQVPQGAGSGFIWDDKGHIVTNYHVLKNASDVRVTLQDQSVYEAKFIGADADKDVAVIQIETDKPLKPIKLGYSANLEVGQNVYAIGNPFGLDHTLTTGIISGLNREIASGNTGRPIENVIQTDAAINPGNSGGPLLDSSGTLIGINTAIYSSTGTSSGVGFAIPSDTVQGIVEQLIQYGKILRPSLGISFAPDASVKQVCAPNRPPPLRRDSRWSHIDPTATINAVGFEI